MKSRTTRMAAVILCGSVVLVLAADRDHEVVNAQARRPIMVTRIYTGPDGLSRAEQIEMKLNGGASEMIKATGAQFSARPAGPASDWHTGPMRQFVITLSGRAELVVGDGTKVPVGPGQIDLIEDTTGKG